MAEKETIHPEVRNVAKKFTDRLDSIGADVCESYRFDLASRSQWDERHAEWIRLYNQKDAPQNPPWEGSSEESLPLLAEGCVQFSARAYKAMFPGQQIIQGVPTGTATAADKARAERIGRHMSWQLMVRNKRYKRDKDRLLISLPLHGSFFTKTYYDGHLKQSVVTNVRATDLVCPYGTGPRNIEDLERKTEIIWMYRNQWASRVKSKYFSQAPEPMIFGEKKADDLVVDQIEGVTPSASDPNPPAMILEQHGWIQTTEGGDDWDPYIITVCAQSRKVLRIAIRWEADEDGKDTDDRKPIEYYTHYVYMENPDGFYGLGLGHLISQPNISVNKLLRQQVDASTLANIGNHSGFISEQLGGITGGELEMQLGKFKKIPGSVEDIKNGIFQFQFPGPSNANPQLIELLMARSDRLASVSDTMSGQMDKVMQPTTVMALIEQGLEVFTTVYERVSEAWTEELAKLYRLNFKFADEEEYFSISDADGSIRDYRAGKTDYTPDMQVRPIADPRLATEQQKLAKGEITYNLLMANPLVQNSPQHIYNVTKRMIETIGVENSEELIPNPGQANLPRVDDAMQENTFALQPSPLMPMAYPDQDHQTHIKVHAELLNNPDSPLTDLGRYLVEDHIRIHGRMSNGQSPSTGVAPGPGNAGGVSDLGSTLPGEGLAGAGGEILDGGNSPELGQITGALGGAGFSQEPS